MKSFFKWIFLMLGVLALSVFLAPVLFDILPFKFERIFNRLIMIFTIALAVWAVWSRQLSFPTESLRWKGFGWAGFISAFAAGFLTLISISFLKMGFGIVSLEFSLNSPEAWAQRIGMSLLSALVIGIIEEVFFRGFIFSMLQKKMAWPMLPCILVTNVFYSLIHFTGGKKMFIGPDPDFKDSMKLLAAPFQNLMDWQMVLPGAFGLFIFGVILTLLFMRTGSLYPCIGLHAGCVFFLKMDGVLIRHEDRAPLWVFGGGQNYDGLLGWTALLILGIVLLRFYQKKGIDGMRIGRVSSVILCALSLFTGNPVAAAQEKQWVSFSGETADKDNSSVQDGNFSPLSPVSKTGGGLSGSVTVLPEKNTLNNQSQGHQSVQTPSTETFQVKKQSKVLEPLQAQREEFKTPSQTQPAAEKVLETTAVAGFSQKKDLPVVLDQTTASKVGEDILPVVFEERSLEKLQKDSGLMESSSGEAGPVANLKIQSSSQPVLDSKKKEKIIKELFPDAPVVDESEDDFSEAVEAADTTVKKKSVSKKTKPQRSSYLFAEHLSDAEAYWISDAAGVLAGEWRNDMFVFPDEAPGDEIVVRQQVTAGGETRAGISLKPSPEGIYRIRFPDIHAVSSMKLRYGFEDSGFSTPPKAAVYIRVWLGTHPLKRIRVFNEKSWKEESLDIGPAAFLKAPTVVTFELTSDEVLDRAFNFFAEAG